MTLRYLGVIPLLLLTSCSNNRVYYNVYSYFDINKHHYVVYVDSEYKKSYVVNANHYYRVQVDEYRYINDLEIYNEFFVDSKELFVYYR